MKTFMLTYPNGEKNEILFENAFTEKEAMKKFRERLGRKILPWKSEVIALKVDGHKIEKEPKVKHKGRGHYFRWTEQDAKDLLIKYSIASIGRANEEFIDGFVEQFKNELKNK